MESIENGRHDTNSDKFTLIVDPSLVDRKLLHDMPSNWFSRILYVGFEGASAWQNVSLDPFYNVSSCKVQEINIVSSLINKINFNTFISLGPGDGLLDKEIFQILGHLCKYIKYIPVDISDGLLCLTMKKMSPVSIVPFGILADFEDRSGFIINVLNNLDDKPRLFSMLGNTLGNIDSDLASFMNNLSGIMRIGDSLIFNISIISEDWTYEEDPRMQYDQYTESIRIFLSRGISRRTGESLSSLVDNFHNVVGFRYLQNNKSMYKFIEYIEIYDKRNNLLITKVGRFRLGNFAQWINEHKKLHVSYTDQMMHDGHVGEGYLLIKRI